MITTPLLDGFDEKIIDQQNRDSTQSYKGYLDDQIERKQAMLMAHGVDQSALES